MVCRFMFSPLAMGGFFFSSDSHFSVRSWVLVYRKPKSTTTGSYWIIQRQSCSSPFEKAMTFPCWRWYWQLGFVGFAIQRPTQWPVCLGVRACFARRIELSVSWQAYRTGRRRSRSTSRQKTCVLRISQVVDNGYNDNKSNFWTHWMRRFRHMQAMRSKTKMLVFSFGDLDLERSSAISPTRRVDIGQQLKNHCSTLSPWQC